MPFNYQKYNNLSLDITHQEDFNLEEYFAEKKLCFSSDVTCNIFTYLQHIFENKAFTPISDTDQTTDEKLIYYLEIENLIPYSRVIMRVFLPKYAIPLQTFDLKNYNKQCKSKWNFLPFYFSENKKLQLALLCKDDIMKEYNTILNNVNIVNLFDKYRKLYLSIYFNIIISNKNDCNSNFKNVANKKIIIDTLFIKIDENDFDKIEKKIFDLSQKIVETKKEVLTSFSFSLVQENNTI